MKKLEKMMKRLYMPMNLQHFGGEPPAGDPPPNPPADPPPNEPPTPPETFTAEQVEAARNAAVKDAKVSMYKTLGVVSFKDLQERVGAQDKLFEELGVKSVDEIKDLLQTAEGKAQTDATLKTENQQLNSRVKDLEIENAFIKSATEHKPHDYDLLFAAIKPYLTTDPDTGAVDNMAEAIQKVKEEKPFLFAAEGGEPPQQPPSVPPKPADPPGAGEPPTKMTPAEYGAKLAAERNKRYGQNK
ncbi:hypothetical protein [Aneurinibacillus aneurinilyticus]|uniref:phage scaffolding protein n=1 Tax=Aneurinibacillus aneurinilyticus TaxID=1391 RepID=UPI0023F1FF61|nr:hypothetical protein [Aneurinibacillus aneurinilyticus]